MAVRIAPGCVFTICDLVFFCFSQFFPTILKVPINFDLNFLIQEKSMGSIFLFGQLFVIRPTTPDVRGLEVAIYFKIW